MNRVLVTSSLSLLLSTLTAQAEQITLNFSGEITRVWDAGVSGGPDVDFPPIPVDSTFSGTFTYDSESPPTDGNTGYLRYLDLLSSSSSVTVNGHEFNSLDPGSATVSSQEANFGFSGVSFNNQPISLPDGWSVARPTGPYMTLQFFSDPAQTQSLDLPTNITDFPTDVRSLVLDFLQTVTVDGQDYAQRLFIRGTITSLEVIGPTPPPQEVAIDVDPGDRRNKLNLNSKKPKPLDVLVFGDPDFDVQNVVPETIGLGDPALDVKVPPTAVDVGDADGDGVLDLLLSFDLQELQDQGALDRLSETLEFDALLNNGGIVYGSDGVTVNGKKGP